MLDNFTQLYLRMDLAETMTSIKRLAVAIGFLQAAFYRSATPIRTKQSMDKETRKNCPRVPYKRYNKAYMSNESARLIFIFTHFYNLLTDARKRPCNCLHWKG
jgi:hypothetical protein